MWLLFKTSLLPSLQDESIRYVLMHLTVLYYIVRQSIINRIDIKIQPTCPWSVTGPIGYLGKILYFLLSSGNGPCLSKRKEGFILENSYAENLEVFQVWK